MKKDKSGIIYCFNKMCPIITCIHNQYHQENDNETIYKMDNLNKYDKNGNCKNEEKG